MKKRNYSQPEIETHSVSRGLPLMVSKYTGKVDGGSKDDPGKGEGDPDDIDAKENGFSDLWEDEDPLPTMSGQTEF